jgi:hypothetical protein
VVIKVEHSSTAASPEGDVPGLLPKEFTLAQGIVRVEADLHILASPIRMGRTSKGNSEPKPDLSPMKELCDHA